MIQSANHGPEYLESRINAFLQQILDKGGFTDEDVEKVKDGGEEWLCVV